MKIRSASFTVIVILWMILLPAVNAVSFYDGGVIVNDNHTSLLSDEVTGINITWTSRTQEIPQFVEDNSNAVGDHVVVIGTFPHAFNITQCELTIWNPKTGINEMVISLGSTISYDTYYLDRTNQTYNIKLNGTTAVNDFVIALRENVTICNFFTPNITVNYPIEIDSNIVNLTWFCNDKNEDDENYYSLWLSRDSGVTFVLLMQNITQTWFLWDASNWILANYIVRIRAYSVDMTSENNRLDDPPMSYWPGDSSEAFSGPVAVGSHSDPPSSFQIYTTWLTYEFGSTNNTIKVYYTIYGSPPPPTEIEFSVTDNTTLWIKKVFHPNASSFTINIDGLSVGTHELSISLSYFGPYDREHLTVVVTASNTVPTSSLQDWNPFMQSLAIGISLGSITIIAIVIILSLRLKRNPIVEYIEDI